MKTIKLNAVMASIFTTGALLLTVPAMTIADPGQGWDVFNTGSSNEGAGERIPVSDKAYVGTSMTKTATGGQGWDVYNIGASAEGAGEPLPSYASPYSGTSLKTSPSSDSDVFGPEIR